MSDAGEDGLVHLRRQTDWTGEPRSEDAAAEAAYRAALALATATLAAHDGGTASHSDDVVTLCLALAEQLGIEGRDRAYLLAAAELHDIGKVAVPAAILGKPAPLDDSEWEVVREHTVTGHRILGAVPELAEVAQIVRHCHERWDGRGYPDGLSGDQIPLAARIVFCADAYHAIRGDRPYRAGRPSQAALGEVERHSGTQFDPAVVAALGKVADRTRNRSRFGSGLIIGGRRSQRLAALLLTLAVAGSALAATGIWNPVRGRASTDTQVDPRPPQPAGQQASGKAAGAAAATKERESRADSPSGRAPRAGGPAPVGPAKADGGPNNTARATPDHATGGSPPSGASPQRPPAKRRPQGGGGGPVRSPSVAPKPPRNSDGLAPAPAPVTPAPAPAPAPLPSPEHNERGGGRGQGQANGHSDHGNGHGYGHDRHDH